MIRHLVQALEVRYDSIQQRSRRSGIVLVIELEFLWAILSSLENVIQSSFWLEERAQNRGEAG